MNSINSSRAEYYRNRRSRFDDYYDDDFLGFSKLVNDVQEEKTAKKGFIKSIFHKRKEYIEIRS